MATATLLQGRSLVTHGYRFTRDVEVQIPEALAKKLDDDPRFDIGGIDGKPAKKAGKEVSAKELAEKVREALDRLDSTSKEHFTEDGRPRAAAVSKVVDLRLTQAQVDEAMKYLNRRSTVKNRPKKAKPLPQPKPIDAKKTVRLKAPKKAEAAAEKPVTPEGEGEEKDPTTEGAISGV